ncbi:hypothetical protein HAX54_051997, partial [Datura stramonium]|nr:hypothetical protein [Datura stramonium]
LDRTHIFIEGNAVRYNSESDLITITVHDGPLVDNSRSASSPQVDLATSLPTLGVDIKNPHIPLHLRLLP